MGHYGEKEVTLRDKTNGDIVGLKFQSTDVRRPLLAVRGLVERKCGPVRTRTGAELHRVRGERQEDHDGKEGRILRDQRELGEQG